MVIYVGPGRFRKSSTWPLALRTKTTKLQRQKLKTTPTPKLPSQKVHSIMFLPLPGARVVNFCYIQRYSKPYFVLIVTSLLVKDVEVWITPSNLFQRVRRAAMIQSKCLDPRNHFVSLAVVRPAVHRRTHQKQAHQNHRPSHKTNQEGSESWPYQFLHKRLSRTNSIG